MSIRPSAVLEPSIRPTRMEWKESAFRLTSTTPSSRWSVYSRDFASFLRARGNQGDQMSESLAAETSSRKKVLKSADAAAPIGPYSQGIQVGNLIVVAGEKAIDPRTGHL